MTTSFEERLLAFHYVHPRPLNKWKGLLEHDPELKLFQDWSLRKFAFCLNTQEPQAARILQAYRRAITMPLTASYEKHFITPISHLHDAYPKSLTELIDPPIILYAKGDIGLLEAKRRIAVIGSRKASPYSMKAIETILPPLVDSGFAIVSGLAKGADAMAHQQAIDLGGRTIAVVGSGFLHPYPAVNNALFKEITENHLCLTEYPPYVKPEKWHFPMRNRIISGLSEGIIVTEAENRSGTMSTIEHALDHGKDIFAVPGSIFSPLSGGPHRLIEEGAKPVWNGFQVLAELRVN